MRETVVVSACRTPIGKLGGSLKNLTAVDLGAIAVREALHRSGISGDMVDQVLLGQVLQAGCGQIPSRQVTLTAGLPKEVPSETLNKVCSSSLRAITLADQIIRSGDAEIIIAGGMESMSNAPFAVRNHRWGQRMFNSELTDLMVYDGLWCSFYNRHMAVHGGVVAKEYGISRQAQDEWALRSHTLAAQATAKGYLKQEITPIEVHDRQGSFVLNQDESIRPATTLAALAKLPPLFDPDNTVTAGNAPGTNDAASAVTLTSKETAAELGLRPLATILGSAMVSQDPAYIATVPGLAVNKLLQQQNLSIQDIDLIEVNEAFAAVALVSGKITGWNPDKVNVNGGAIAYGHPIGASGGRIFMTLIYELRRRGGKYGIACICSGAAQGDAVLIRIDD